MKIMVTVNVPIGLGCDNIGLDSRCEYFDGRLAACQLFGKLLYKSEDIDGDWRYGKCSACLEACERAKAESVTDCNGLEEK